MIRTTELFDSYLEGTLTAEERSAFARRLDADPAFAAAFAQHRELLHGLRAAAERESLKGKLREAHAREIGSSRVISLRENTFARRHGKTIAVAASTAFIAVLSTVAILSTGGYLLKQQSNQI